MKKLRSVLIQLATPVSQRHGFIRASILLDWHLIVEEQFADFCHPEKITFPLGRHAGGILTLRTSSGFALALGHLEPLIIEKINRYFGYKAVERLHLKNGPVNPPVRKTPPNPQISPAQLAHLENLTTDINNEKLRIPLIELGKGIYDQANQKNKNEISWS
jgi:hypothetical protein